jgi:hypothetical protein
MTLPSKTNLQTLDYTWRGLPFCWVEAIQLNTQSLDVTWRGLPFVAAFDTTFALQDAEWHPMEPQTNPLTVSVW